MQVTRVSVLQKSQIIFGSGITQGSLFQELRSLVTPSTRIVVITDENVYKHHGSAFLAQFTGYFDQSPLVLSVKPGEISKCYETKEYLERKMLQAQCTRDTLVIALGGGVVGDLAGFVAATYMRGISFIQVPTTLLAMVDSSIGGKTGINTPEGKNLVGAFWQPKRIFIDPIFLDSLPIREIRNGLAECIKMFAIGDAEMFSKLEDERVNFENSQYKELLQQVILRSAEMKADIVTRDERESGVRSLLNFGHTIGHAIEGILSDVLLHGECISIGMIKEAEIARALGHLTSADVARLKKCCQIHGLPVSMPPRLSIDDLMEKMTVDKKNTAGGDKRCVLLQSIGKPIEQQATIVADDLIRLVLSRSIAVAPENPPAPISGKIRVPGSKSISNRVLLLAALGSGVCRITGLLHSDDTKVMMNAITSLGIASFSWEENGNILVVHGGGGHCIRRTKIADESTCSRGNPVPVYLGNAGTASRFLTTVCTMIHSGDSQVAQTMLQGNHRMYVRPVSDLVNALRENGCSIEYQGKEGCLPLLIEGTGLPGGELTLNASISSQYVSSILMCAPYAHNEVTLHIAKGKAISQSYIDMTVSLMRLFGIQVEKHSPSENQLYYKIQRGVYQNPAHFLVEADASSSTYPLAIAAITGGTVTAEAIGCHSLQGDSAFCGLLEKMGCTVEQTEIETTVSRCDRPLKGIDVDMEPLTDAFMTAAVVAAVCHQEGQRITRITGIANQRVKECNRIAAMVTELGKCGVTASELPDGIEIHGRPLHEIHGAVIDCHDDHRIAMSFGVLGCVVPGIIIDDKDCVSKTYAEFWEDLYRVFGVRFDTANASTDVASPPVPETDYPVVIVIGMRGAGKSTQCKIAGEYLNMEVIDLDIKFEEQLGNIKLFIQENGWESFRAKEAEIFEGVLEGIATSHHKGYAGAIISCGGGIVETASCRALLKQQRIVIHFRRCIDEIVEYLSTEQERPSYGEEIRKVWDRRAPLYEESSRFEFLCAKSQRDGNPSWSIISRQFCQFVERLLSDGYLHRDFQLVPAPLSRRICDDYPSYFLCLTYSNIEESLGDIRTVTEGVSAVELRVDQLESHTPLFVAHQISLLRCYCNLPVIFTVRSVSQGGRFEYSPSNESNLWELYEIAIRMGIEYIDVEQQWSKSLKSKIFQLVDNVRVRGKRTTQMIVSEHCYTLGILSNHVHHIIRLCEEQGLADIVKVVIRAQTADDTIMLRSVAAKYSQTKNAKPLISLAITEQGKLSRVFNKFLCPVTHPLLPVPAAPGQLSVHEINLTRSLIGLDYFPTSANQFYLFGSAAIRASPSPAMHNAAFKHLNIPYQYSLFPCESAEEILRCLEKETTKGGNVTMPHKLSVIPHLSSMTPAAKKIGAVNTIVKLSCGKLHGDNTDWLGIANPIIHMANENSSPLRNAIVLGAGGTSRAAIYALRFAVGVENIFIWNPRTLEKAQTIADCFGISAVSNISELSGTKFDVVVSTLPPIAVTEAVENAVSAFVNPNETIVLDVVYFPTDTPILRVAANNNCHAISGSKMLLEQGVYGFEQWTNVRAPYNTMNLAIQTHLSTFQ